MTAELSKTVSSEDRMAADRGRWEDAVLAAAVMAICNEQLGGIVVRSQCGPVRDAWFALLKSSLSADVKLRRLPLDISEGRLIGGLDLAVTLSAGRAVAERGLLAETDGGILVVPSAERVEKSALTAISSALDLGRVSVERDGIAAVNTAKFSVVAFDESRDDEAPIAELLRDRLAIEVNLDALCIRDAVAENFGHADLASARVLFSAVTALDRDIEALCATALALGIASLRGPLQALVVARASAALGQRTEVSSDDLEAGVRLVLVPRATRFPTDAPSNEPQEPDNAPPESLDQPDQDETPDELTAEEMEAVLLAAAKAALPPGLLETLQRSAAAMKTKSAAGRSGAMRTSQNTRGRRAGSRRGDPRSGGVLDLLGTVRAAAPWQSMRRRDRLNFFKVAGPAPRLEVRRDDFRLRRFKHQSETATIFVVDASGSAALNRLAEAKGAVELLLADCYARRDHVALIAFRGKTAELLLPLTRSLVRAKRSLAGLPGGGGTPLATATDHACEVGKVVRRKGQTATLVFLTDGRANVNRSGLGGRVAAQDEANAAAKMLKAEGLAAIVIDTSPRPGKESEAFAAAMGAIYLPLPYADATSLSKAVRKISR
jgi:magnesium chelatase subunit D